MKEIIHNDYDKISDICMWLSKDYVLKFNVVLNKRTTGNNTSNYYKEFGYNVDNEFRVNISRNFSYYLTIEAVKKLSNGWKHKVHIGVNDIYFVQYKLQEIVSWFTSEKYKSLFVKTNNKIKISIKVEPAIIKLQYDEYLEVEPSIITYNNGEQVIGVRIYVSSDYNSFFMDLNTLLSFNYFISTFNMYQSAQLMLNYLGRPANGTNHTRYNNKKTPQGFFERTKAKEK